MRNPYEGIDPGSELKVTSDDFTDQGVLPLETTASKGGKNISPQLAWSSVPAGTKSIYIHCYDPDAPTPSGYWHWSLVNLDPGLTHLPRGAAKNPPQGSITLRNDAGKQEYMGAAPPAGHGSHRYFFTVYALDAKLPVTAETTPTTAAFMARMHTLARGSIVGTWENR